MTLLFSIYHVTLWLATGIEWQLQPKPFYSERALRMSDPYGLGRFFGSRWRIPSIAAASYEAVAEILSMQADFYSSFVSSRHFHFVLTSETNAHLASVS